MNTLDEIAGILKNARRAAFFAHVRPDGDSLGAAAALAGVMEKQGKTCALFCDGEIGAFYDPVPGIKKVSGGTADFNSFDVTVALDCAEASRLGKYAGAFKKCRPTVNIDHHRTNDRFAKYNYVDAQASSTCEIVFGLINGFAELDDDAAACLYIGISTDTGNFTHANTTPAAHMITARLLEYNVDFSYLNYKFFKETTLPRTRLLTRALNSLRLFRDNKIAVIFLTLSDLAACGCKSYDTEGIVDYSINIDGVEAGVCISETARNSYKVSLRSKRIDASAAASIFGGGGHRQAAGCMLQGKAEDVIDKIVNAIGIYID